MDTNLPNMIVCPKCRSNLEIREDSLICRKCNREYRIQNGIPIMLIDAAEKAG